MPVSYNNAIKKPHLEVEYTPELIEEIEKCMNDFFHFCEYVKVVHPDHGRVKYVPR
jgi:hypothetical protein